MSAMMMRETLDKLIETTAAQTSLLEQQTQQTSHQTQILEKTLKNIEVLAKKTAKIEEWQNTSATKLTCHEKRFCELYGEGTDSARMLDDYCRAMSALCSRILLLLTITNYY